MFAPPDRATRTRYLVAEIVVVLVVGVLLGWPIGAIRSGFLDTSHS